MPAIRWGAVVVGAMAGLGITFAVALALFVAGTRPSATAGGVLFIFGSFLGQVVAGYVAGRFSAPNEAFHGSQAGLALYAVTAALTLAAGGELGFAVVLFGAIVAMILGSAGGVMAGHQRHGPA